MGIFGSYTILAGKGKRIPISSLSGTRIAIDIMVYAIKNYRSSSGTLEWIQKMTAFLSVFKRHNIEAIVIFDGDDKPKKIRRGCRKANRFDSSDCELLSNNRLDLLEVKYPNMSITDLYNGILQKTRSDTHRFPTSEEFSELIGTLKGFGYRVLRASGAAENACCGLVYFGEADYVLSEDSDVILCGAPKFLMKFDGERCRMFSLVDVAAAMGLDPEKLRAFGFILGTDFNFTPIADTKAALKRLRTEGVAYAIEQLGSKRYRKLLNIFTPSYTYEVC